MASRVCIDAIAGLADNAILRVDLQAGTIGLPQCPTFSFDIDNGRCGALWEELDEIAVIEGHLTGIVDFEKSQAVLRPWLATVPALIDV